MKQFRAFVIKEFYHILRDYRTLLILLAMPPILILLFGYTITNEIQDAKIAILDYSKDATTSSIKSKLLAGNYFKLEYELNGLDEVEAIFRKGSIREAIVFESNFEENLAKTGIANIRIIADATDPNTASTLLSYTSSIIKSYLDEINENVEMPYSINTEIRMRYNEELRGAYLFVPGLITVILMLVSAMMTSISITREKELGTMESLLVSPMQPLQIIIAKMLPYLFLAIIDAVIILIVGNAVFGVPVRGSVLLLMVEGILFIITALSLGLLISTITSSQQVALMMSLMGLMLPTIILSGFIYPISNMPQIIQWLTHLIPAKWFNLIIKSIMLKGAGLDILWKETLILAGFAVFFISLSLKKFNIRLQK